MAAIAMTQSNLLVIDSLSNSHRSNSHSRGPVTQPWSGKMPLRQKTSRLTGVAWTRASTGTSVHNQTAQCIIDCGNRLEG